MHHAAWKKERWNGMGESYDAGASPLLRDFGPCVDPPPSRSLSSLFPVDREKRRGAASGGGASGRLLAIWAGGPRGCEGLMDRGVALSNGAVGAGWLRPAFGARAPLSSPDVASPRRRRALVRDITIIRCDAAAAPGVCRVQTIIGQRQRQPALGQTRMDRIDRTGARLWGPGASDAAWRRGHLGVLVEVITSARPPFTPAADKGNPS